MPRGDRTGPWGQGPMTGRGAGFCANLGVPGYANPYGGWCGMGRGRGGRGGYGNRHWFRATGMPRWARAGYAPAWGTPWAAPTFSPDQEMEMLQQQADDLKQALADIEQRLQELSPKE